jgi:hypothetical protein
VKPFEPQQVIARVLELLHQPRPRPAGPPAVHDVAPPTVAPVGESGLPPLDESVPEVPASRTGSPELDEYFERLDAAFDHARGVPRAFDTPAPEDVLPPDETEPDEIEEAGAPDIVAVDVSALFSAALDTAPPMHDAAPAERAPVPEREPTFEPLAAVAVPLRGDHAPDVPTHGPARAPEAHAAVHAAAHEGVSNGRHAIADAFSALLAVEQGEEGAAAPGLGVALWAPVMTNAFVDEVARRVLERMAPDTAREVVVRVVSEIAERVVREEVGRARERGLH